MARRHPVVERPDEPATPKKPTNRCVATGSSALLI